MKAVLFYHSLISDWNHGNAHFLRGVVRELLERGHQVAVYEPEASWSLTHLLAEQGPQAVQEFYRRFPGMRSTSYRLSDLDLEAILTGADLVLVHEWNDPELIRRIGCSRRRGLEATVLFHDTHHRAVSAPRELAACDLSGYDGALVFGQALREVYERRGWVRQAWVWHEAADTSIFRPMAAPASRKDVVWIGNWGDEERTAELSEFLLQPVAALGLRGTVHGVHYSDVAQASLRHIGLDYGGWLPNHRVPEVFAGHRVTVHVPRRQYVEMLPGIPTIRPFEALACGIPLIVARWEDTEGLFTAGTDYLPANSGAQVRERLREVLSDPALSAALAQHGRRTVLARHTCAHRVDELLAIHAKVRRERRIEPRAGPWRTLRRRARPQAGRLL